jgi:hypothetical protein
VKKYRKSLRKFSGNFPEIFRKFPETFRNLSGNFPEIFITTYQSHAVCSGPNISVVSSQFYEHQHQENEGDATWLCSKNPPPLINFETSSVERMKSFKLLGLTITNNLNWDEHINAIGCLLKLAGV